MASRDLLGVDLSCYKPDVLDRRLQGFLARVGAKTYADLWQMLNQGRLDGDALADWVPVKISRFFRNSERFRELGSVHLPRLKELAAGEELRVWSAGCSVGAEAYSLAMLLEELQLPGGYRILATDLSAAALETARAGAYGFEYLEELSVKHFNRWMRRAGGLWAVDEHLRARVDFRQHDLLSDGYPEAQHLVVCRNVIIYFEPDVQRRVVAHLAESLVPGGVLFLGGTDLFFRPGEAGLEYMSPCFCRRASRSRPGVGWECVSPRVRLQSS